MANAVAARIHGDDYQALVFWQQACRLLRGEEEIELIEIESEDLKSLDDVVLIFKDGHLDERGCPLKREGFQVKYHVDFRGCLNANSLIDPAFINATSFSFFQRAFDLWEKCHEEGLRIVFYSCWTIDPNDALGELVSTDDGHIEVKKLFTGGSRSKFGRVRNLWCSHLNTSQEMLGNFLDSVRILTGFQIKPFWAILNKELILAGLRPVRDNEAVNPYYDLARTLIKEHRTHLTRIDLLEMCKKSGLWQGPPMNLKPMKRIGVRSRLLHTEGFEEWTETRLDLLNVFNDRQLKDGDDWYRDIYLSIAAFLQSNLKLGDHCEMWLPVHSTIAVVIGYILGTKSGIDVHMHQSSVSGTYIWCNKTSCDKKAPECDWTVNDVPINAGADLAIAISVAHDIMEDVRTYLQDAGLHVSTLRYFSCENCGPQAIADQEQAVALVDKVVDSTRQLKRGASRTSRIHVFFAMPNFMAFALGQRLRPLGLVQLYEHNFESGYGADYAPSIQLPPLKGEM